MNMIAGGKQGFKYPLVIGGKHIDDDKKSTKLYLDFIEKFRIAHKHNSLLLNFQLKKNVTTVIKENFYMLYINYQKKKIFIPQHLHVHLFQ